MESACSLAVPKRSILRLYFRTERFRKDQPLSVMRGIYHPDSGPGAIRVLGEATSAAANDRVGYLPEERGLYKKMTVRDVLRFYAELKGRRDAAALVPPWLDKMGLADWADKKVEALSKRNGAGRSSSFRRSSPGRNW